MRIAKLYLLPLAALTQCVAHAGESTNIYFEVVAKTGMSGVIDIAPRVSINNKGYVAYKATYLNPQANNAVADNLFVYAFRNGNWTTDKVLKDGFALKNSGTTPWQQFGDRVMINNSNEVVARRYVTAVVQIGYPFGQFVDMPLTYIEAWDPFQQLPSGTTTAPIRPRQFGGGDAGIGTAWPQLSFTNPLWVGDNPYLGTFFDGGIPTRFVPNSPWDGFFARYAINDNGKAVMMALNNNAWFYATPTGTPYSPYNYATSTLGTTTPVADVDPSIDNVGNVVAAEGAAGSRSVVLYTPNFASARLLAGVAHGFTSIGKSPVLSPDGQFVLFYGNLSDPNKATVYDTTIGPGLFAVNTSNSSIFRLAGAAGPPQMGTDGKVRVAPGQIYRDLNFNGLTTDDPVDTVVTSFDPSDLDSRPCVNSADDYLFTARSAGAEAVFKGRINRNNSTLPRSSSPYLVLTAGQSIPGFGLVEDLEIYDSLSDPTPATQLAPGTPGKIAVWCKSGSTSGIVTVKVFRNPIIIIPGIAGSHLTDDPNDHDKYWLHLPTSETDVLQLGINQNQAIFASDVLRQVQVPLFPDENVYANLISYLSNDLGYREYSLPNTGLSNSGPHTFDIDAQRENAPEMFLFPYDWRFSNEVNADRLAKHVKSIQDYYRQIYGNNVVVKPTIVAHSMGGLLARRYLLNNGSNDMSAFISIASPFLGAAKVPFVAATGEFIPFVSKSGIRSIVNGLGGVWELLASRSYFALGGRPFREEGWDFDGDGTDSETYSDWDKYMGACQRQFRVHDRIYSSLLFHERNGQDDWSGSGPNVPHLQFVGIDDRTQLIPLLSPYEATIVQVIASQVAFVEDQGGLSYLHCIEKVEAPFGGDGTVPTISASRTNGAQNLNSPQTTLCYMERLDPYNLGESNSSCDHNGLCSNKNVLRNLAHYLEYRSLAESRLPQLPAPQDPGVRVVVTPADPINVSDSFGASTTYSGGVPLDPPGIFRTAVCADSSGFDFDDNTYKFDWEAKKPVTHIDVRFSAMGDGGGGPGSILYTNLQTVVDRRYRLTVSPGYALLQADLDGNGSFETTVQPNFVTNGPNALDKDGPEITSFLKGTQIGLDSTDPSGIQSVKFRFDQGALNTYVSPVTPPQSAFRIEFLGIDNVGNQSSVFTTWLRPALNITADFSFRLRDILPINEGNRQLLLVDVTNKSKSAHTGPFALGVLASNRRLPVMNRSGFTQRVAPVGVPFIGLESYDAWQPNETRTVRVDFGGMPQISDLKFRLFGYSGQY